MKFLKEIHDFGPSTKGVNLTYDFTFTNTGDDTLTINRIESDCTCMNYVINKMVLLPGETAIIKVTLNTSTQSGLTVRRIKIFSNIKGGVKEISVTTEVK
ncbi:MAG: DUF1573 domain-containing protein [Crocinitomicaceae bacterium]|nr:DUF1573 domain-containing protein [Crocinitomicaceae bacterium]